MLLYTFTALAWKLESLSEPVVTPVRVKKSTVIEQRNYNATISQAEKGLVIQWNMSEDEIGMLEGSTSQCYYYTYGSTGLQFAQAQCVDVAAVKKADEEGDYTVRATLKTEVLPASDCSVCVVVKRLNPGMQTVPVSAISYVDGVSCLMQLVYTSDGWRVHARKVSVGVSNDSVVAVASPSDFSPKELYAAGAYRELLDGEKVRILHNAE